MRSLFPLALLFFAGSLPASSHAQALTDTVVTWKGYSSTARCRVRIYPTPPDEDRRHTVVLRELAANNGPSTVSDLPYLAEEVGRRFEIDPTQVYWILHWGPFSYEGARADSGKELFLRATFSRTKSRHLSSPRWDLVTREEVREYTDRQFE